MLKRLVPGLLAFAAFVAIPGCFQQQSNDPTILDSKAQPYVADVPVPRNFELDERRSTHDRSPGKREIRHFYMGKSKTLAAKNFYMSHMPEKGWELLTDELRNGVYFLNYRNPDETCEVRIEEVPQGRSTRTQICVEIKRKY